MDLILCIGGLDPSGAAGILADARMVESQACRVAALNLLDTWQGPSRFGGAIPTPLDTLQRQWEALFTEERPAAVKIGAVADIRQADWLAAALEPLQLPLVIDPVLLSSSGGQLGNAAAIRRLAPLASLLTPNRREASELFGLSEDDPGWSPSCPAPLLVTGADHASEQGLRQIEHRLLQPGATHRFGTRLRPGRYRGSGCLLASAIACALARGESLPAACVASLEVVDRWLARAVRLNGDIHLPQRPA